jgi:hypothetical protein
MGIDHSIASLPVRLRLMAAPKSNGAQLRPVRPALTYDVGAIY